VAAPTYESRPLGAATTEMEHIMTAQAESSAAADSRSSWSLHSFHREGSAFAPRRRHRRAGRAVASTTIYRVTDCLHQGRTVQVPCDELATTVSAWLAELGADSPLVEDLARAVRAGDWPAVYALGESLSVDVAVAA
jgi:hypothetical protein